MHNGSYENEVGRSLYSGRVEVVMAWQPARQPCEKKFVVE
jgi:hypothetical protein